MFQVIKISIDLREDREEQMDAADGSTEMELIDKWACEIDGVILERLNDIEKQLDHLGYEVTIDRDYQ